MEDKRTKAKLSDISIEKTKKRLVFSDEENYSLEVDTINLESSYFIRLRIKNAEFNNCTIKHSVFEDVYAKKAVFKNIDFTGTVFRNCNFEKAIFRNCNFRYCRFQNCKLPVDEIISCLPKEPNLRKEVANNLKTHFLSQGKKKFADKFLDIEINAEKQEILEIFKSKTSYYKERYDFSDRLNALFKYIVIRLSNFFWGYGHRLDKLFYSLLYTVLIFSLILFLSNAEFTIDNSKIAKSLNFLESLKITLSEIINYGYLSYSPKGNTSHILLFLIRAIGLLYLGLFVSTVFRKINR